MFDDSYWSECFKTVALITLFAFRNMNKMKWDKNYSTRNDWLCFGNNWSGEKKTTDASIIIKIDGESTEKKTNVLFINHTKPLLNNTHNQNISK